MSIQPDLFSAEIQEKVGSSTENRMQFKYSRSMYGKNLYVFEVSPDVTIKDVAEHIQSSGKDDLYFGYTALRVEPDELHIYVFTD